MFSRATTFQGRPGRLTVLRLPAPVAPAPNVG
jgi:hypothetical protein